MAGALTRKRNGSLFAKAFLLPLNTPLGRRFLLLLILLLAPGLIFWLSQDARSWLLEVLGYGIVPVSLWLFLFLICLLYRGRWILHFWRSWLASGALVAASLATLSLFRGAEGLLEESTLGGKWGQVLGGFPIPLGGLKVAALLFILVPAIIMPRRTWSTYKRGFVALLLGAVGLARWAETIILHGVMRMAEASARALRQRTSRPDLPTDEWALGEEPDPSFTETPALSESPTTVPDPVLVSQIPPITAPKPREEQQANEAPKWPLPSFDLITKGDVVQTPQSTLDEMARLVESVLGDHGVEVDVESVRMGPRIIRFGLVPGWVRRQRDQRGGRPSNPSSGEVTRVRVHSILAREKDLALALKTHSIRMEAPVPGESVVGLEVPNPHTSKVYLRSIIESDLFQKVMAEGGLPLALGEDIGGAAVVADLKELPHLLIAGATGSGKSVCLNAIIASLLLTKRPDELRLVMIDPKRVELTPYNGIPHLAIPVIVDTDDVVKVLEAMIREMFHRFRLLEDMGVRNIDGYNSKAQRPLAHFVLIIDELADLMMVAAYEAEQALVRLGQLGRATGIHLVLATQRPSVNVVTGLLKANIPSRIAFAVASQVDSRVILDGAGAEKLLGKGDMLLLTQESPKPRRVQGTYISDEEGLKLVQAWRTQSGPPVEPLVLDEESQDTQTEGADEAQDELLQEARKLANRQHHISPSTLQRRLQIGYARALQLMELLEEEGLVVPGEPGKSRETVAKRGA